LDSQTTNTHPSPQPTQGHVHWGHPFLFALLVLRLAVPADVYSTSLRRSAQLEVHLRFARIAPDQSDRHRSLRLGNPVNNTHLDPPRGPGSNTGSGPPRRRSRAHLQATGSTSSGESLRTLPTALPTRCRVTLAGST